MEKDETEWLPVVEFEGTEYVMDVQNRCFSQLTDPTENVAFHSDEGKEMVRAMPGTKWRARTPRERMGDREGMV